MAVGFCVQRLRAVAVPTAAVSDSVCKCVFLCCICAVRGLCALHRRLWTQDLMKEDACLCVFRARVELHVRPSLSTSRCGHPCHRAADPLTTRGGTLLADIA